MAGGARFLTLVELAEELGVSQAQAYALVRSGDLPAMRVGGRGQWRVARDRLEEWIAQQHDATAVWVSGHPLNSSSRRACGASEPR